MNDADRDLLIEAVCSPFRERDAFGRILAAPAWWDLTVDERGAAFDAQLAARSVERALDADGLSATARAVLEAARATEQLGAE